MNPASSPRASVVATPRPHSPDTPSASSHVHHALPSPTLPHHLFSAEDKRTPAPDTVHVLDTRLLQRMSNPIKRKPLSSNHPPLPATQTTSSPTIPDAPGHPHQLGDFHQPSPAHGHPVHDSTVNPRASTLSYQSTIAGPSVAPETAAASQQSLIDDHYAPQSEDSDLLSAYDDSASDAGSVSVLDRTTATILEDNSDDDQSTKSDTDNIGRQPPMFAPKPIPPHLNLNRVDPTNRDASSSGTPIQKSLSPILPSSPHGQTGSSPKTNGPASPFATFFGWGNQSPSVTDFSSIPSPSSPSKKGAFHDSSRPTTARANASTDNALGYCESYLSTPPPLNTVSQAQIEEMEDELKAISSELAASIRREMDLEDLVERLQEQVNNSQLPGRRTSDYFSDSGLSSAKASEFDQSREEVDRIQRKSEQEKASIRLELTSKLQDERLKRQTLDDQIRELSRRASQMDLAKTNSVDTNDRVRTLEATCDDLRRKLNDERDSKSNFAELLAGLKTELSDTCNERDNLRDEVVPQLRARIEGLETEAAEYANLTYESTKMQQELQHLKDENKALRDNGSDDVAATSNRTSQPMSGGLFRSNSVAASSSRGQRPPPLGLNRSKSVKNTQLESREVLADRLKDAEAQRDALHSALKNLLERQEIQNRDNEKKIRALEQERERLLLGSPRKGGFQRDIANLRTEVNVLRRRAEDALDQKWQVEKGLIGLKMDLDRAEEEISLLRNLLQEKDILIPPSFARLSNSSDSSAAPATSESLQGAYKGMQLAYTESLKRVQGLEAGPGFGESSEETQLTLQRFGQSANADDALADELAESAAHFGKLATQVRKQLSMNSELRQRLADAVAQGEADRKANSERISGLQERLRVLEEELVAAQSASEERIALREEEVLTLKEAHNNRLHRRSRSIGMRSPGLKSPRRSPMIAPIASPLFPRSPGQKTTKNSEEQAEIDVLRKRVAELEKTLSTTENEMQDIVAKMSTAQIEVMNLQEEREVAARETRRLQKVLEEERVNTFEGRFKTLGA